jgi:hypothetical protein
MARVMIETRRLREIDGPRQSSISYASGQVGTEASRSILLSLPALRVDSRPSMLAPVCACYGSYPRLTFPGGNCARFHPKKSI